jgi:mono/diheme cytochrome c family protein
MRRILVFLAILALIAAGGFYGLTAPSHVTPEEVAGLEGDPVAGEAVFWAGGCASCHAAPDAEGEDRLILSGGRSLSSDFGTFLSPNISPDPTHGIGGWTLAEFITAMQNGISPEGRHYYPAFPYTSYRLASRQDMADLFAYLGTLPASDAPSRPHQVGFPVTLTRGIGLWNRLHLQDDFVVTGDLTEQAGARALPVGRAGPLRGVPHAPRRHRRARPDALDGRRPESDRARHDPWAHAR